jgi:hypothetical protein
VASERRQLGLREHERDQGRAGDAHGDQLAAAPLALYEPTRALDWFRSHVIASAAT